MRTEEQIQLDNEERRVVVLFWQNRINEVREMDLNCADKRLLFAAMQDEAQSRLTSTVKAFLTTNDKRPSRGEMEGIVFAYDLVRTAYLATPPEYDAMGGKVE